MRERAAVSALIAVAFIAACGGGGTTSKVAAGTTCDQAFFKAGGSLAAGDVGCGGFRLGRSLAFQDCLSGRKDPAFDVVESTADFNKQGPPRTDPSPTSNGCELRAEPQKNVTLHTVDHQPAPLVMVADFTPRQGGGAVALGWCPDPCLFVSLYPNGSNSVRYKLYDGDTTLAQGETADVKLLIAHAARLILRVAGGQVDAWLDGVRLASASSSHALGQREVDFIVSADPTGTSAIDLYLQRVGVLEAG
jgi:hypothetical protein